MLPIINNVAQRGPCDHPTSRPGLPSPARLVIRVDEKAEIFIEVFAGRAIWLERHCLEEPSRMCAVPFCRARIGHGLCRRISIGKWFTRSFTRLTNIVKERMTVVWSQCRLEELRRSQDRKGTRLN